MKKKETLLVSPSPPSSAWSALRSRRLHSRMQKSLEIKAMTLGRVGILNVSGAKSPSKEECDAMCFAAHLFQHRRHWRVADVPNYMVQQLGGQAFGVHVRARVIDSRSRRSHFYGSERKKCGNTAKTLFALRLLPWRPLEQQQVSSCIRSCCAIFVPGKDDPVLKITCKAADSGT